MREAGLVMFSFSKKKNKSEQFSPEQFALLFLKYILERVQKAETDSTLNEYDIQLLTGELSCLLMFAVDFAIYDYLDRPKGNAIREAFYNHRIKLAKHKANTTEAKKIIDTQEDRIARYSTVLQKAEPEKWQEAIGKEFARLSGYEKNIIISMYGTIEFIGILEIVQNVLHEHLQSP